MNRLKSVFSIYLTIGLVVFGFATQASAQGSRSEKDARNIVRNLNSKIDDFKYSLDNELRRSSISRDEEAEISDNLQNFEDSLKQFQDKLNRRRENADDAREVLSAAKSVNDFLIGKRLGSPAQKIGRAFAIRSTGLPPIIKSHGRGTAEVKIIQLLIIIRTIIRRRELILL